MFPIPARAMTGPIDFTNWDAATLGYRGAAEGEPLFPDAPPPYTAGWCYFHGCENPYSGGSPKCDTKKG